MLSAKYTVVLKTLLDDENVKPLIDKAMSTYPTYTPIHPGLYAFIPTREELNKKILSFYKYREIGFETIGRFLDELETSLCEIMPYYNQLYKSVDIMNNIDDIFGNVDIVETFEQDSEGTSKGTSEGSTSGTSNGSSSGTASTNSETSSNVNSYNKNVSSDTPQGNISTSNTGIDSVTHASNISWSHDTANDSGTTSGTDTSSSESTNTTTSEASNTSNNETEEHLTHTLTKKGNQGVNTYAHDMLEFRELFMNIEQRIIHDDRIAELFMLVY